MKHCAHVVHTTCKKRHCTSWICERNGTATKCTKMQSVQNYYFSFSNDMQIYDVLATVIVVVA